MGCLAPINWGFRIWPIHRIHRIFHARGCGENGRFQVPPDLESCFRVLNEDAVWLKGMLGDVRGILISSLFDVYIAYLWWWSIDFQFVRMRGSTANQRFLFVKTLSGRPIMFPMLAAAGREIYQIPWVLHSRMVRFTHRIIEEQSLKIPSFTSSINRGW